MTGDNSYNIRYVAIYLRKSRGEEEDLIKHETILSEICKKNNWKYVEYKEIGSSDSIELRPQMKKLLEDIGSEIYDAVLVVDYDRLSRGDMGQQDRIKKAFRKSNTLIITPNKIYDLNDEIDDTYTDFQGLLARQEYKMITKRLRQGKKVGSRMGNWTNGTPPFGYCYERYKDKYNEKGLVVNDNELQIYRLIIGMALDGLSTNAIAMELNKREIKTRQGKLWSSVAICRMLRSETYLGKIISNKHRGDGHKIKKASAEPYRALPREEWIIVENCHEPMITQDEFDKIQLMIEKRTLVPPAARSAKGEFTGILRCGCCGHTMQIQKRKVGKDLIRPCKCFDSNGNRCSNRGGQLKPVRDEIKKAILRYRDEILNKLQGVNNRDIVLIRNQLQTKNKELKKYEDAVERIQDSYDFGDYSREEFLRRKSKWDSKIGETKNQISLLERQLKSQEEITDEERLNTINYFLENIDIIEDVKDRNKLYHTILDSVVWKKVGKSEPELEINFL
ncbi:MAG: recombinase family protein [Clostridium lundense]|nr:recombinase family protein [Clostridium lundense]